MRTALVIGLLALLPALGHADFCAERTEAALDELAQAQGAVPTGENAARTRAVLEKLCRDAQGAAAGTPPAAMTETAPAAAAAATNAAGVAESVAPTEDAEDPESTELFGVEIKQAPKGAAGYERASKRP